jgi:hypothetical protein
MRSNTLVLALAAIVVAGAVAGLTIVVHRSQAPDHRPPPVSLADALETYRAETAELLDRGEFGAAEANLLRVLPLVRTDLHEYHHLMGRSLMGQPGRLDEAVEQFQLALQMEPGFPGALDSLARIRAMEEGPLPPTDVRGDARRGEGLDLARGRACSQQFQRGPIRELHATFTESLAAQMPVEALTMMHSEMLERLGPEVELVSERIVPEPHARLYVRTARYERHAGEIEFVVRLSPARSVAGLQFRAAFSDPSR